MEKIVVLVIGIVVGVVATLAFQNPRKVGDAARDGITHVQTTVERERRDQCVREFLDETGCFQKQSAKECDARIVQRCGLPQ